MPLEDARIRSNWNEINNLLVEGYTHVEVCTIDEPKECNSSYAVDSTLRFFQIPDFNYFEDYVNVRIRGSRRFPPAPCYHLSCKVPLLPWAQDFTSVRNGLHYTFLGDPTVYLPIGVDDFKAICFQEYRSWQDSFEISDAVISSLDEEAFNYFSDIFPEKLSAGEFIQGFTQLRELIPTVKDSILQTIAGGYLTKEFGWDNLQSDLRTLSGLFDSCKERLEYLRSIYGNPTRLGFARNITNSKELANATMFSPVFADWPCGGRLTLESYSARFHATCWITQTLDFLDGIMGWFRVVTSALGLNNPVKQFWNLLPFSFVVDWFLHVDRHLDNLTRINPPVGWDIGSVTHSVLETFTWRASQIADQESSSDREIQSVNLIVTRYSRDLGLPFHWELLNLNELSENQLTLLLALFLG